MGNTNNKTPLRKTQSVPDVTPQRLSPDAQVSFSKEKSLSQQRLNQNQVRPGKPNKGAGKKQKHLSEDLPQLPPEDAVFLPEFPLRGDLEELDFEVIDVIAKGAFGNVIKVQREDQKRFYAMKVLDKAQILQENAIRQCKDEAAIQSMAGEHPFIVKAHEYWQSKRFLYIVLDYVPHGDMFTLWTFHGAFPEDLVRLYIAEISMVIDYLHNASVIYRDVKMENILFDPKGHIQLTDFGLAKWLNGGEQTRTVCGTLQYMAPEVLAVYPYGHAADWWSVGILMYAMLAGKYPVDGADTHTNMAQKVFECDYLLPSHISDSAQDVIHRFLTKSPHKRLSNLDVIQDLDFFQDLYFSDLMDGKINPITVVPEDFFPMTGESWAPNVVTAEEQSHFDQFDDTYDTGHRTSYASHPLRHHTSQYRPPSIAQRPDSLDEPYRKRSYSQPMQVLHSEHRKESSHREESVADQYRKQNDIIRNQQFTAQQSESYDKPAHAQQLMEKSDPYRKTSSTSLPYPQQMNVSSGQIYGQQQSHVSHPSEAAYSCQTPLNQQRQITGSAGASSFSYNGNSIDSPSYQSSVSTDFAGQSGSTSGSDRVMDQSGTRQSGVSNSDLYKRSNSGDGLALLNPPSNYSPAPYTTNNNYSSNGYAAGSYRTVEAPATVTLKSPGLSSSYNPQGSGFSHADYSQQASQYTSTVRGPTMQNVNIQPTNDVRSSQVNMVTTRNSSSNQAYVTIDSPPVIKLPSQNITDSYSQQDFNKHSTQNPYGQCNQDSNKALPQKNSYHQEMRTQPQSGTVKSMDSLNNFTSHSYYNDENRRQERIQSQSSLINRSSGVPPQVPVKPVVSQKPTVPKKPSVAAKPSAMVKPQSNPVRPQPAPRKSLRGQLSNPVLPVSSPSGQTFSPTNNQPAAYSSNSSLQMGSLNAAVRTSPLTGDYSSSLPLATSEPIKTFSNNSGFSGPQAPNNKSPGFEMDSFKWNLPADTTPTFL
ncbi:microtubule-associated serine/threonine-protein kinase 3-like isoform X1 [Biomphalaria pfeifferi]|uniref:Microtubule-associated serine/threonine-protein kinase 3-like isoform X1 n=1 Tax=Biomphalaria pfeifferi TaxID=112525 RepID=A0AAD8FEH0_BIOPF|nr:microtubule-associated serine/threonine-protein kinase 3-like isoform X1 [Biomphalaria pfeifferi]